MRKFFMVFLSFVLLYHVLVTFFSFGQGLVQPYVLLLIRDFGWILAIWFFLIRGLQKKLWNSSIVGAFFHRWWWPIIIAIALTVMGIIASIILWVTTGQIVVGIKYTLYYLIPFFTAIYVGIYWKRESEGVWWDSYKKFIHWIWIGVIVTILVGWIWQIAKNFRPDLFMQFWYGPLGDYVFGEKPPLYYLTWPQGFQRLSGIFSWPNNYGYFLVAFFWLYWFGTRRYVTKKTSKILLWGLYVATLLATFSRGAILWVLIQVVLISYVIYHAERKIIVWAIVAWVLAVWALSILKRDSTAAHLQAKFSSLQYVSHAPRGFWLGSSWPSSLSQWWYLPENFFVQVMMDIGVLGFVLWWAMRIVVLWKTRDMYIHLKENRILLFFSTVWFIGLMIEWLFLHVLEDSMVNYLYFIVWWLTLGFSDYALESTQKITLEKTL